MRLLIFICLAIFGLTNCAKKTTNLALKDHRSLEGISIGMPISDALKILDKKYNVEKKSVKSLDDEPESIDYVVTSKKKESSFMARVASERPD